MPHGRLNVMRWLAVLLMAFGGVASGRLMAASATEDLYFNAAALSFQDGNFERAEKGFGEFARQFPNADRFAAAISFQAQSRYKLKNYDGAIELVTRHLDKAGKWADEFRYWLGEAQFQRGDFKTAAATFRELLNAFPATARRLDASFGEALAHFKLGELRQTVDLLTQTNGAFQQAAEAKPNDELVFRGYMLMGEASLALKEFRIGEDSLTRLTDRTLRPELNWQLKHLLVRLQLAGQRTNAALQNVTNLLALATNAALRHLQPETFALHGSILEGLNELEPAIQAYTNNLAVGLPEAQRRQAMLKIVELTLAQNKIDQAIKRFEAFLAQNPQDVLLDLVRVTLGELRLKEFYGLPEENRKTTGTNLLSQAKSQFDQTITNFPNSQLVAKAYLNRGWCLWEEGQITAETNKTAESQVAFQAAVERLPLSEDQAVARFKLADCQFQQKDFRGAVTNYQMVMKNYAGLPRIKATLFDQALYQMVKASIEMDDLAGADDAMERILSGYPESPFADRSMLLVGQALNRQGKPAEARAIFDQFEKKFPNSTHLPDVQLALARTYMQEENWVAAIGQHDRWLTNHLTHPSRPQAAYDRAWLYYKAGNETNALDFYKDFVAQYPTNRILAPLALNWVADYYRNQGKYDLAEQNYQLLFQNTNWPPSDLTTQARLMAGRMAVAGQSFKDAQGYFTNLINDPTRPTNVVAEALMLLGDTLIEQPPTTDPTNNLSKFSEAINAFDLITKKYRDPLQVPRAWGRIGDCNFQLMTADATGTRFGLATNAYQQVLLSTNADVAARCQASVKLATVFEKQAQLRPEPERSALLKRALEACSDVVYGNLLRAGELTDPFWYEEAGKSAARIAEALQNWELAVNLYERISREFPQRQAAWEKKVEKAREQLRAAKNK